MTNIGHGTRKEAKKPGQRPAVWETSGLPSSPSSTAFLFTSREIEVLRLLVKGTSTREIARILFISVTTARNHIQNISRKLKAHSRVEAVSLAHRTHLI